MKVGSSLLPLPVFCLICFLKVSKAYLRLLFTKNVKIRMDVVLSITVCDITFS